MPSAGDRILLVENDPVISDLIARQTLRSIGYQVDVVTDASSAIKLALQTPPDLVIADLNIPGLSAKDLLYALTSQGVHTPVMVIANKGQDHDIIQAFRLGAVDYIAWPSRDAEVLSAVEHVLRRVQEGRDRQRLGVQVTEINHELQRTVRELTAIINIGKAVISVTDQQVLFQKIVDGAGQVAEANLAWLLVRDQETRAFLLTAQRGLPEVWAKRMNQPMDDGVSSFVAASGETLTMTGAPLQKFRIVNLGKAICVVPIKVQAEVIGLLVVVRKEARPFSKTDETLLEAVADYASISLVNARLFKILNDTVHTARESEQRQNTVLDTLRAALAEELQAAMKPVEVLLAGGAGPLSEEQRQALQTAHSALQRLGHATGKTTVPVVPITLKKK